MHPQKKLLQLCDEAEKLPTHVTDTISSYKAIIFGLKEFEQTLLDCYQAFCCSDGDNLVHYSEVTTTFLGISLGPVAGEDADKLHSTLEKVRVMLKRMGNCCETSMVELTIYQLQDLSKRLDMYLLRRGWNRFEHAYVFRNQHDEFLARFSEEGLVTTSNPQDAALYFYESASEYVEQVLVKASEEPFEKMLLSEVLQDSDAAIPESTAEHRWFKQDVDGVSTSVSNSSHKESESLDTNSSHGNVSKMSLH